MGLVAFVLKAECPSIGSCVFDAQQSMGMVFVGTETNAGIDVESCLSELPIFLTGQAVSGVSGADSLDTSGSIDSGKVGRFGEKVDACQPSEGVLLIEVGDAERDARVGPIPNKRFGFGDGGRRDDRVDHPGCLFCRTGRISSRDSERAEGLPGTLFLSFGLSFRFSLGLGWEPEGSQREHHEDALGSHLQVQFPSLSAHLQQVQGSH